MKLSQNDIKRFWAKVDIKGPNDCWSWLAGKTKSGYGVFSIKHKWIAAHRVSFFIKNGYLPNISQDRMVMHDCENPECQNYNHLLDGTNKQNQLYPECLEKHKNKIGFWKGLYGEKHLARWGKKHSSKTKRMLSQKASKRGGWHKGLKRSLKTKNNISLAARGENNGNSHLTEQKVKEILRSTCRNIDLAHKYNVDPSIISSIRRGTRWKHIQR